MEIDVITTVISTLGFPVFVGVWMLTKGSRDTEELKRAVNELTTAIKILSNKKGD